MNPKGKPFRFKQFSVYQEQTAMKVGTDGVILGAWTKVGHSQKILDVGSGTGLLSLMLAQKSDAKITAIEVDLKAYEEALYNISISPWSDRIEILNVDFKDFEPKQKFDLIICNPPYFKGKTGELSRSIARQNIFLPYNLLINKSSQLLNANGALSIIFPYEHLNEVLNFANSVQLYINEVVHVKGHKAAPIKRTMLRLTKSNETSLPKEQIIIIEEKRHQFTKEYIQLLKPYLLHL